MYPGPSPQATSTVAVAALLQTLLPTEQVVQWAPECQGMMMCSQVLLPTLGLSTTPWAGSSSFTSRITSCLPGLLCIR